MEGEEKVSNTEVEGQHKQEGEGEPKQEGEGEPKQEGGGDPKQEGEGEPKQAVEGEPKPEEAKPAEEEPVAELPGTEFHDRILEAFELFDNEGNKMIEQREVGTVMRWLGCVPTEADIAEAILELKEKDYPGLVTFNKFLPLMTQILLENRYKPVSKEELLAAFQVLDTEKSEFLTREQLIDYMTTEGEALSNEEMEDMLGFAVNTENECISYKDYVNLLIP